MMVEGLGVLLLNKVLEISDEWTDEDETDKGKDNYNPEEYECKIGAYILDVVVEAPRLILGDLLTHVHVHCVVDVTVSISSSGWLKLHESTHVLNCNFLRSYCDLITSKFFTYFFANLELNFCRSNSLLT